VLAGVRAGGAVSAVYDIDPVDLNANITSIEHLLEGDRSIDTVLIASMYGNPAALDDIEKLCGRRGVHMIDDAAQAFGARLGDRFVGTFGDIGLMSFSPGKPTVAHLGSFYWANRGLRIPESGTRIRNSLFHRMAFNNFLATRANVYRRYPSYLARRMPRILRPLESFLSMENDALLPFESSYLHGVLIAEDESRRHLRCQRIDEFLASTRQHGFRIVRSTRGQPNPHKIVIVFDRSRDRDRAMKALLAESVYCQCGYRPICKRADLTPVSLDISGRVLELPLEFDNYRFSYLIKKFRRIVSSGI
jgi:dTDP-4-amino-4,6-dideoxygalactose transaminase